MASDEKETADDAARRFASINITLEAENARLREALRATAIRLHAAHASSGRPWTAYADCPEAACKQTRAAIAESPEVPDGE